jgi:hypothetical protein
VSDYRSKTGINQTLVSLTKLSPQPTSAGVMATRRIPLGDGSVLDQGLYVEWLYNIVEDAAQLLAILTPLGLHTAKSAAVTIYTRDDLYAYKRYNGVAVRPAPSWQNYYPRNVTILIRSLELST